MTGGGCAKWIGLSALVVIALATLAGILCVGLATSGQPIRSGTVRLPGGGDLVTVDYDQWGVPSLRGSSADDVARALGYVHANDRLTQMELGRRAAFGNLAELFGEAALPLDIAMRRFS